MKSNLNFHKLRQYLLRDLADEAETENIEQAMLADPFFLAEVERAETELIENYLDRDLSAPDRKRFETYFLIAPERQEKVRFLLALRELSARHAEEKVFAGASAKTAKALHAPKRSRGVFLNDFFRSGFFKFAAMGLLTIVVLSGGMFWYLSSSSNKVNEGLVALNLAYKGQRPTEARLTGLDYAQAVSTRGGGEVPADLDQRSKAGLLLIAAKEENPSADAYRALGLFYASLHQFDSALTQFDKGGEYHPVDPRFFSDHGAVLLEKARSFSSDQADKRTPLLENSIAELNKALERDPSFLPALFNRALCLEEMRSNAPARDAWQKYLDKDASSAWAKEARDHLRKFADQSSTLKTPDLALSDFLAAFDRGDPREAMRIAGETKEMITGMMISDQLTRGLLSADAQGAPKDAERMLSALNFLGKLEKENNDDSFFLELAAYYQRTTGGRRAQLNEAQNLLLEGYGLCLHGDLSQALPKFTAAQKQFANAGNTAEALKTAYWISYCEQRVHIEKSAPIAEDVARQSEQKQYRWLQEQALLQSASAYISQSNFSAAIRANTKALDIAQKTLDRYGTQKSYTQLADVYSQLNDRAPALENVQAGLREQGTYFNSPRQRWRNYQFASQVARRFGFGESALTYALEDLSIARGLNDFAMLHDSYIFLSSAYRTVKDYDDSLNTAGESLSFGTTLDDGPAKEKLVAFSLLEQAETQRALHGCPEALETYGRAIDILNRNGLAATLKSYAAWKGKLFCHDELKQNEQVEDALPSALKMAEQLRGQIEQEESRTSFFSGEQSIYEFAAAHALKKGDDDAAFGYIEKSKARTLLDKLNLSSASPAPSAPGETGVLALSDMRQRLPAGSQLVQYAVLPDKLYIWVVTGQEVRRFEKNISAEELEAQVREFSHLISTVSADATRLNEVSASLYALLLQPIEPALDQQKSVVIIPDKILCYLPFEPLRDSAGQFALKNYHFAYAPSGTLFVTLSEKAASQIGARENFIGVGNPAFDRNKYPDLEDLPAAEREVAESASFYPSQKTFVSGRALKKDILAVLPTAAVFHFAGHFVANDISPQFSKFLLTAGPAKEAEEESYLTSADIGALKLRDTHLVVLSACQTAIENYYRGEGAIGAARTFFAAGVPAVVASRWKVDSSASAELMAAFHRNRRQRGFSTAESLRAAQLELIESERFNSPYYWAAFAAIGGLEKV
jgi:CHAT domain-containing protein